MTVELPIAAGDIALRALRPADAADVWAFQRTPALVRYLYRDPMTRDEVDAWIEASPPRFTEVGRPLRLAVTRADDRVIGYLSLFWADAVARQCELGYAIGPDHAGNGYATQAATIGLGLAFDTFGFHRVFGRVDTRNAASIAICERLGMRREAHLVDSVAWDGRWGSEYIFALLQREWRARPHGGGRPTVG